MFVVCFVLVNIIYWEKLPKVLENAYNSLVCIGFHSSKIKRKFREKMCDKNTVGNKVDS